MTQLVTAEVPVNMWSPYCLSTKTLDIISSVGRCERKTEQVEMQEEALLVKRSDLPQEGHGGINETLRRD